MSHYADSVQPEANERAVQMTIFTAKQKDLWKKASVFRTYEVKSAPLLAM